MGRKARKAEPSLDDTRWQRVGEEYQLLSHCTGDPRLALIDLNEALTNGRVRSMRRHLKTGKREQRSPQFWLDHVLRLRTYKAGWFVCLRHPSRPGRVDWLDDYVFFLWQPDIAMVWPALREGDREATPLRCQAWNQADRRLAHADRAVADHGRR